MRAYKSGVMACMGIALLVAGPAFLIQAAQSSATSKGQVLFEANCVACHGPKGDGDTVIGKQLQASDLRSAEIQKKTDAEWTASILNGKDNKMPPFKGKLKPEDVTAVLKYVRETLRTKK